MQLPSHPLMTWSKRFARQSRTVGSFQAHLRHRGQGHRVESRVGSPQQVEMLTVQRGKVRKERKVWDVGLPCFEYFE